MSHKGVKRLSQLEMAALLTLRDGGELLPKHFPARYEDRLKKRELLTREGKISDEGHRALRAAGW